MTCRWWLKNGWFWMHQVDIFCRFPLPVILSNAMGGGWNDSSGLAACVCPSLSVELKEGYCFPLKKPPPQSAYQRPLNIPMGSLKITQMFAFVTPTAPLVLTYTPDQRETRLLEKNSPKTVGLGNHTQQWSQPLSLCIVRCKYEHSWKSWCYRYE